MTREDFRAIYLGALDDALGDVESRCNVSLNIKQKTVELHGAGCSGSRLTCDEAFDKLFISQEEYYKLIDVAVKELSINDTTFFIRVSDHNTGSFDQTWSPNDYGPFKILETDCASLHIQNGN